MTEVEGAAEPGARILLVDDDERVVRATATGLMRAGYQVIVANDGATAIQLARDTPPEVAIVDLEMPTSGLEVIRHLKEIGGAGIHVIVATGHDDEGRRSAAFAAGTNDFVVKPVPLAELRRRVAAAMRTQREFLDARLAKDAADRKMTYGAEATALLAHDLNNALAVSLANIDMLRDAKGLDDDDREALQAALRALRRMAGLVANFVDIARFEDAAIKPRLASVRVASVLAGVLDIAAPAIARGVELVTECPADLTGWFDPALIERVLHNLVGNAIRYCKHGRIALEARAWEPRAGIELVVANTGPLIAPELAGRLFGKYARGAGGKRGMGLYFCRLVVDAHGGRIAYTPRAEGPAFVIQLPGS